MNVKKECNKCVQLKEEEIREHEVIKCKECGLKYMYRKPNPRWEKEENWVKVYLVG